MVCESCITSAPLIESLIEENIRLKRANKVLRTVNGLMRRHQTRVLAGADGLFLALCETDRSAEVAFGELWGSGEFDCGPQDYEYIVARCIAAIRGTTLPPHEPIAMEQ